MPHSYRHQPWLRLFAAVLILGFALVSLAGPQAGAKPAKPSPPRKPEAFSVPAAFPGPLLQQFLAGPMKGVEEIVFAVRVPGHDHWYVTFGNYADHSDYAKRLGFRFEEGVYWGYGDGGRLCRLNLRTGKLTTILEDSQGGVRDPQIHYDGKKILFSYRKGSTRTFHLYEINIDGTGLRQLTDGPDDDIEPAYCPDGSVIFGSSRCHRFVNCWYTRVATLHRCDADGKNVRLLSSNNDHDNTPWVLPDGRVLYMRWEYVDRSQVHFHHLWTMNPDGTNQSVYYGNMTGGIAMLDAKPIPATEKVVVSWSPGHGRPEHLGPVAIVDPRFGPDDPQAVRMVSKTGEWKDPWAFDENCFLVAHPRGICVMDGQGNAELVYRLPETESQFQCHEPRPLTGRPRERLVPARTDLNKETARLVLQDIYDGRNMAGVERGSVKKLLVLQQLPKPVNFSGGMEPLTIGGSFTLAEVLGEVPVEADGSANLEVPALRSLFFVALDQNDLAVKRMHSFTTPQPGEVTGCVGCHEQRTRSPLPSNSQLLQATRRPASPIQPIQGVPSVLDFPRDIQPVLDRHCVSCHRPGKRDGGVDFSGDKTAMYSVSYWTMQTRNLVSDARNQPFANRAPYSYGSAASRLLKLMDGSHHGAKPGELERKTVRLWIETSATYPGTYAALGCGDYPAHLPYGDLMQRCGSCHTAKVADRHGKKVDTLSFGGAWGRRLEPLANIEHPEQAYLLLAPLAREAGGLALCKQAVFKDSQDPLYRQILASLRDANRRLQAGKRFDMPGFRPNPHYVREMQRFGVLPQSLAPEAPVDPYPVDRAYWDTFRYQPPGGLAAVKAPELQRP